MFLKQFWALVVFYCKPLLLICKISVQIQTLTSWPSPGSLPRAILEKTRVTESLDFLS